MSTSLSQSDPQHSSSTSSSSSSVSTRRGSTLRLAITSTTGTDDNDSNMTASALATSTATTHTHNEGKTTTTTTTTPMDHLTWHPYSWKTHPISQQPDYHDAAKLDNALTLIRQLPPLVHHAEVDALREQLAEVAAGRRFLLQGGDCAERFADCSQAPIENKFKIMLQMSLILSWIGRIPIVRIGRMAGQYGKPRSSPVEKLPDGTTIASFKGDNINRFEATAEARTHDPDRLVQAHFHSAATLNYVRALIKGGYADLHNSYNWDLSGVLNDSKRSRYQQISRQIADGLEFMEVNGIQSRGQPAVREVDFFTSHEGLVLDYEAAVTRPVVPASVVTSSTTSSTASSSFSASSSRSAALTSPRLRRPGSTSPPMSPKDLAAAAAAASFYNLGTHFLWIGNRTRALDCAHIEYFRGIRNPIGIKVDSSLNADELLRLMDVLDPNREPGRLTLITRFGADKIFTELPRLIRAVQRAGRQYTTVWSCDPMHGNTYTAGSTGLKTRSFDAILAELQNTFEVHAQNGSHLGGVHFELTGEHVTECVGGPEELDECHLPLNYTTYCDPRLNYLQAMEMSFLLSDLLRSRSTTSRANGGGSKQGRGAAAVVADDPSCCRGGGGGCSAAPATADDSATAVADLADPAADPATLAVLAAPAPAPSLLHRPAYGFLTSSASSTLLNTLVAASSPSSPASPSSAAVATKS